MFLENVRKIAHDLHKQNEKESKPKLFRDTIDALLEREIIFENEFVNESNGKAIEAYWDETRENASKSGFYFLNIFPFYRFI